jgi:hypothetical protein
VSIPEEEVSDHIGSVFDRDVTSDGSSVLNEGAIKSRERPEFFAQVPEVEGLSEVGTKLTMDLRGLVAVLSVTLLIAKDLGVRRSASSVDLLVKHGLFTELLEFRPEEVEAGATSPELI